MRADTVEGLHVVGRFAQSAHAALVECLVQANYSCASTLVGKVMSFPRSFPKRIK